MWLTLDSICSQCAELTLHKLILYWKDFHFHQFFKYFVNFDRFILIKRWVKGKLAFSSFFCVSFGFVTKTRLFNILLSVFFQADIHSTGITFLDYYYFFTDYNSFSLRWISDIYFSSSILFSSYILKISLFVVTNGLI